MSRAYAPPIGMPRDLYRDPKDLDDYSDDEPPDYYDEWNAERDVKTSEWWLTRMDGESISYGEAERIATCLARCMKEIDRGCKGDSIAVNAILDALSDLKESAIKDATEEGQG